MSRRWDFISAHADEFGVQRLCRVLHVSRSGYYRWPAGADARAGREAADDALIAEIREIHTPGFRRKQPDLDTEFALAAGHEVVRVSAARKRLDTRLGLLLCVELLRLMYLLDPCM